MFNNNRDPELKSAKNSKNNRRTIPQHAKLITKKLTTEIQTPHAYRSPRSSPPRPRRAPPAAYAPPQTLHSKPETPSNTPRRYRFQKQITKNENSEMRRNSLEIDHLCRFRISSLLRNSNSRLELGEWKRGETKNLKMGLLRVCVVGGALFI